MFPATTAKIALQPGTPGTTATRARCSSTAKGAIHGIQARRADCRNRSRSPAGRTRADGPKRAARQHWPCDRGLFDHLADVPANVSTTRLNAMQHDQQMRKGRMNVGPAQLTIATVIVVSGALIAAAHGGQQNTDASNAPLQGAVSQNDNKPAESKPGGTRPTNPAPEPARPAPEAERQGAKAALPPAPAEKIGPPIEKK